MIKINNISIEQLPDLYHTIAAANGKLLTLWGSDERVTQQGFVLHLVFFVWEQGTLYYQCKLSADKPAFPDMSTFFPVANRLQRACYDLLGIKAAGAEDQRPWLRHGAWPENIFPLRHDVPLTAEFPSNPDHYHFVRVSGNGVHEIPVGPVHAGTIEPGHFRFSVVGERILRLEERLGYTHKAVAKRLQNSTVDFSAKLAGYISGDSTVAYAWAYSMAIENIFSIAPPQRALWLRALLLERERIMNHLGDLGALGNDGGLAFGLAQFSRLKEDMLRANEIYFAHRYLMDLIIPGGIAQDINEKVINAMQQEISHLHSEVDNLKQIYDEHSGLQDRFMSAGILTMELADQLGVLGLTARASGLAHDLRKQWPLPPYDKLAVNISTEKLGDVAARVSIRFKEIFESLRIIEMILKNLPTGAIKINLPEKLSAPQLGFGLVEGWRGPILFAVQSDGETISWAHAHDPSWQNWLALEHAILNNIVPDFPLINKSFNLSYSGQDM